MRVWITRPEAQACKTQQLLAAEGITSWLQPVMVIEPLTEIDPQQRQWVMDLDHYRLAIFISQNAVRYGMALIDQFWPQIPVGLQFLAIGKATASALQEFDLIAEAPTAVMDSEALLALPAVQQMAEQKVIIFKGVGGRTALTDALRQRGARVDHCEVYRRQPCATAPDALAANDFGGGDDDCVLAYSGESVEFIDAAITASGKKNIHQCRLVVPGPRVAHIARTLGFTNLVVAENATDAAMLAALKSMTAGTSHT